MTIKYCWENVKVNVPNGEHTIVKYRDIIYYLDIDIKVEDIVDYLMPYNLSKNNPNKSESEIQETRLAAFYMRKMYSFLKDSGALNLDELENDDYFVEYMRERYEEKAFEDWNETNEPY